MMSITAAPNNFVFKEVLLNIKKDIKNTVPFFR